MTIGIYTITNMLDGKVYVGKSINCESRLSYHKNNLQKPNANMKTVNRHLYHAVQKYGWGNFKHEIIQTFRNVDEQRISAAELFWIDQFGACDRSKGYNLRRDSSSGMVVHPETKAKLSESIRGENNPNYDNGWCDDDKRKMSEIKKQQHLDGVYGDEWKRKIGKAASKHWRENPNKVKTMAQNVRKTKQKKHNFIQMNDDLNVIRVWNSVEDIIKENPTWKWQQIYSVCNGHKKRIYGYKWKKVLADEN